MLFRSNSIPDYKTEVGAQKYVLDENSNSGSDETNSSDSSAAASPAGPSVLHVTREQERSIYSSDRSSENESRRSPHAAISIFEKSVGERTYALASQQAGPRSLTEVDLNGNKNNLQMKNATKHKADSGISDNTTSDESSDEFPIPRIISVQTLQTIQQRNSMPTSVIQYSGKSTTTRSNKDSASQGTTIETFGSTELRSQTQTQKRSGRNESGSPTVKKRRSESACTYSTNSSTDLATSEKSKQKVPNNGG